MALVSVIMPSYNHEKFISKAIESVLNQSFEDLELIIIDDGSRDNSKKIIISFKEKDNRIRTIFHKKNIGIAKTLNDGIEASRGKFIAIVASDDVWYKDKLEKQLEVLKENENLIVWSEGLIIDAHDNSTGMLFTERHNATNRRKSGNIFGELLKGNFIFGSSLILKKQNLGNIRFDEELKYLNDYKFVVDLATRYEYHFVPEPLAMYRIHGSNTTLTDKDSWIKDGIVVRKYFLDRYNENISNHIKSKLLLGIGIGYLQLEEKTMAKQYIRHAIKADPFNPENLIYPAVLQLDRNSFIYKFLRRLYRKYKATKKLYYSFKAKLCGQRLNK